MDTQFQLLLDIADGFIDLRGDAKEGIVDGTPSNRQLVESFYFDCESRNLRPRTLSCYAQRLRYLMDYGKYHNKSLAQLDKTDIKRYIVGLISGGGISGETINGRIRVFKVFYRHCHEDCLIPGNPMADISLIKVEHKIKQVLTSQQLELLFGSCGRDFYGRRNRAMMMFMLDSATRVGEMCNLELEDLDLTGKIAKVRGKSRRERYVPFSAITAKNIHRFIWMSRKDMPGSFVFPYRNGDQLTTERVYKIFRKIGDGAGVRGLYPHLLRHTGATRMIEAGMSLGMLQQILGHSTPIITNQYVHPKAQAMQRLHEVAAPMNGLQVNN